MKIGVAALKLVLPYIVGAIGAFAASEYTDLFAAFCKGAAQ